VQGFADGKNILPANFLYYVLVYIFCGLSNHFTLIMGATALITALFITIKFQVTRWLLQHYTQLLPNQVLILSSMQLVVMSLPSLEVLTGGSAYFIPQLPPNTWHNSTLICVFPWALLLFQHSYESIFAPNRQNWLILTSLIFLNIIIKPSYFLVLIPSYPLAWVLFTNGTILKQKIFWLYMLPVLLGIFLLLIQHHFLYHDIRSVYYLSGRTEGAALIKPFHVWRGHARNLPLSFLLSLAFPIYLTIAFGKQFWHSKWVQYIYLSSFFALCIYVLVSETNEHTFAKNYSWQLYITNYLLFTFGGAFILEQTRMLPWRVLNTKHRIALILYGLHVLSGFVYLLRMLITRDYH
jgi:hypothetical protein